MPTALNSRLPNETMRPAGNGSETPIGYGFDLLAIPGDQVGKREKKSRSVPYLARQLSVFRPEGPESQLVNVACFLVPDDDARGNTVTHGFILVPAAGPYVQQRGCARALYYLAPEVLVVGDTSEAREGEKLPSLC